MPLNHPEVDVAMACALRMAGSRGGGSEATKEGERDEDRDVERDSGEKWFAEGRGVGEREGREGVWGRRGKCKERVRNGVQN